MVEEKLLDEENLEFVEAFTHRGIHSNAQKKVRRVVTPYLPIEYHMTLKLAKNFKGIGKSLLFFFNYIPEYLYSSEIYIEPDLYAGIAVLTFFVYFFVLNFILVILQISPMILPEEKQLLISLQLPLTTFISLVLAFQVLNYPVLLAKKKAWKIDKYMSSFLRHLTVEVRSGATLFEALEDIARADYDVISKDCAEIVNSINSGLSFEEAIEYVVLKTKSEPFRRVLLQIESAFSSGANMGEVLMQLSRTYFQEQQVKIQKYGKNLEFYSRIFLMVSVILPVMLTILLAMTALMPVIEISSQILYILLVAVLIVQFMFITYAKEQRPAVYD